MKKIMKLVGFVTILNFCFMLSACSILSPVKTPPVTTYVLKAKSAPIVTKRRSRAILYVSEPQTIAVFNTLDMAYSMRRFHVGYYSQNRWAANPSDMLLPSLVESLQCTTFFKAVVPQPYYGKYDYVLNTQIFNLIQDYRVRPARARVTIRAQLLKATSNRVIATKEFSTWIPMQGYCPYAGVIAMNVALSQILSEITQFTIDHSR